MVITYSFKEEQIADLKAAAERFVVTDFPDDDPWYPGESGNYDDDFRSGVDVGDTLLPLGS
jgi:hypothetical protein